MIIESKPLRMMEQLLFGEQRPGLPAKGGNTLSEGQIQPLNECRLDDPPEAIGLQEVKQLAAFAQAIR